jgi:hypothetical protein
MENPANVAHCQLFRWISIAKQVWTHESIVRLYIQTISQSSINSNDCFMQIQREFRDRESEVVPFSTRRPSMAIPRKIEKENFP